MLHRTASCFISAGGYYTEMYEDIVETVREPLIVLDADLRVLEANRSFYKSFRVIPEETIGNLIYDLGNGQWDIPSLRELLENILPKNNKFDDYEVEHIFSGIGHKIMLLNARRIVHKETGPRMILLAIEDITERRLMENEIKDYEERFRRMFETAKDGLLLIDKQNGKIVNVNPAIMSMLDYFREEFIGKQLKDVGLLKDTENFRETIRELIEAGFVNYEDVVVETKQGKLINVDVHLVDRARFIQCNVRDITERKKLSAQLLQSQKMEAIGHLVGGIAHDFNNILTAIIGYGSLLHKKMAAADPLHEYVEQILAASDRAANLTQSLLAYSRKQVMEKKPADIKNLLSGIQKILDRLIGEDIEFKVHMAAEELIANIDSGQIEQVLLNLATNARDAMPHGGLLTISSEHVQIDSGFIQANSYGEAGNYAVLSVADSGIGMDENTAEHIFEPFFTTKEVGKGTGLGLAMVYSIIRQHNGFINVYSRPGEGAVFKIYLPLMPAKEEIFEKAELTPVPSGSETILLAEDDQALREVSKIYLENYGYKVLEASDGEDALNVFSENRAVIMLIVTDIIMPKMYGNEVYERARMIRPDIKCLFMSGYSDDVLQMRGILKKDANFIPKPFSPYALIIRVREVLDS
ncbi:MAG: PAS domain-containing sensor histidine kinase [Nitrospiraceae bacterium]|nr:MAG: PAS domain-containing sensor histidine kinase [Nitrospiraceae bacterium]